ncbi:hypothetical protein GCM10011352_12400 [Marinobacterium zhoushanense]|uniref:Uncharacterized protein n=1 Tax=Marinobacterium zhoushanense TaxID=1679163 RepID=A0ABQ1K683_9GAMM|nr:hypothetical protein GCM10011352_12400 [Marinobacterium zhoushanense]
MSAWTCSSRQSPPYWKWNRPAEPDPPSGAPRRRRLFPFTPGTKPKAQLQSRAGLSLSNTEKVLVPDILHTPRLRIPALSG